MNLKTHTLRKSEGQTLLTLLFSFPTCRATTSHQLYCLFVFTEACCSYFLLLSIPPPSVSLPHFLLLSTCPCSSSASLSPSFIPSLSPPPPLPSSSSSFSCALDWLSFPLTHTLRQHPPHPLHFYLHTHLFAPPSHRSSRFLFLFLFFFFPSHTNTYHLWHLSPACFSLFFHPISSISLFSHTLNLAVSRVPHTLMLIGTQGQSTLSPKLATGCFACVFLDSELS